MLLYEEFQTLHFIVLRLRRDTLPHSSGDFPVEPANRKAHTLDVCYNQETDEVYPFLFVPCTVQHTIHDP